MRRRQIRNMRRLVCDNENHNNEKSISNYAVGYCVNCYMALCPRCIYRCSCNYLSSFDDHKDVYDWVMDELLQTYNKKWQNNIYCRYI